MTRDLGWVGEQWWDWTCLVIVMKDLKKKKFFDDISKRAINTSGAITHSPSCKRHRVYNKGIDFILVELS